jgi:hypothetical protein
MARQRVFPVSYAGLYTFSHLFFQNKVVQNAYKVGNPAEAYLYSRLRRRPPPSLSMGYVLEIIIHGLLPYLLDMNLRQTFLYIYLFEAIQPRVLQFFFLNKKKDKWYTATIDERSSVFTGSLCHRRPSSSKASGLCHGLRHGLHSDLPSSCRQSGCWEWDSAGQSTSVEEPRIAGVCLQTRGCPPLASGVFFASSWVIRSTIRS